MARLIKAIHGPHGLLDSSRSPPRCSPWLDIVREFKGLAYKDINLFSFIKKKVEMEKIPPFGRTSGSMMFHSRFCFLDFSCWN